MQSINNSSPLLSMFHGMSSSPVASAELGSNPFSGKLEGAKPTGPTVKGEAQFADVLGLVSDLEVADSQDVMGKEGFLADAAKLEDSKLKGLKGQTNQAQLGLMNAQLMALGKENGGENIGRQNSAEMNPKAIVGDKAVVVDAKAQAAGDMLLKNFQNPKLAKEATEPDGDAVIAWGHALVRGDIKEVKLENSGPNRGFDSKFGGDGISPRATADGSAVEKALMSTELGAQLKEMPVPQKEAPVMPVALGATAAANSQKPNLPQNSVQANLQSSAASSTSHAAAASDQGFKPFDRAAKVVAPQGPVASQGAKIGSVTSKNDSSEGRGLSDKAKSQKGSDFLLDKSVDHQVSNADFRSSFTAMAAGYGAKSAVSKSSSLGQPGDSRVHPQTLQFVADKVNELKTNGGGRLHVALNPEGMGTIDIRVGMRAGQVHVQLSASNPDTLKMLQTSKADLVGKLSSVREAMLDIGAKVDMTSKGEHKLVQTAALSSENFVSAHKGEAPIMTDRMADKSSMRTFDTRSFNSVAASEAGAELGAHSSGGSSQFSMDRGNSQAQSQFGKSFDASAGQGGEGRERAFEQWERSFKERESA